MYRKTAKLTYAQALLDAMLGGLDVVPGTAFLVTPKIELFAGATPVTPTSAWADFTKATFHGYAVASVTLNAPGNLVGGDQARTATVFFHATSGGSLGPQQIDGYILSDGAAIFYGGELFQTPVQIAAVGDFLQVDVILPLLVSPSFQS